VPVASDMLDSLIPVPSISDVARASLPLAFDLERTLSLRIVDRNSIVESNESLHGRVAVPKIIKAWRTPGNERW
jgi:hypothetical protein